MPHEHQLSRVIDVFQKIYQTIEIRVALIKHETEWKIVAMTARLCIDSRDAVKGEFRKLEKRFGKLNSERFDVRQYCYSFSQFNRITNNLLNGHLQLGKQEFKFDQGVAVLSKQGRIEYQFPAHVPRYTALYWPILTTQIQLSAWDGFQQVLRGDFEVTRDVEVAGHYDSHSAIKHLLETDFSSSTSGVWLWLMCDVPARIDQVEARRANGNFIDLHVTIETDCRVSGIACNVRHMKNRNNEEPCLQAPIILRDGGKKDIKKLMGRFKLDVTINDNADVEIIHKQLGRLYHKRFRLHELLRIEERNPLFVALKRFCREATIRDLLERPDVARTPQMVSFKGGARLYEVSVQWLLSLLGFKAVWLHGYETVQTPEYDYGSVDCLAYHEGRKVLLLVNCTTAPPNQHEFNRQLELQDSLRRDLFSNTKVRLLSIVFSSTSKVGAIGHFRPDRSVRMFYREDIADLLDLIHDGREIEYIDRIVPP